MGVVSLGYKLFKDFLFHCFRRGFGLFQGTWWFISGRYISLWRSRRPVNYDWSTQVLNVLFRHKLDLVLEPSGPNNFISSHHSFQNPNYIMKDNITLYYVTKDEAVFVETDPSLDATHSDNGSFLRVAQFQNAKRIIVMPISAFHRLAEETIGEINGKLIFVTNTTRCGSTLLSQVFEETGKVVSLSEPDALNAIGLYTGKMPQGELDRLVINSMRILCKPISRQIDYYLLKPTGPTIDAVPLFLRLFPESKQVFMYREGIKVAQSLYRAGFEMPLLEITFYITKFSESLTKKCIASMGLSPEMFKVKCNDGLIFTTFTWACLVDKYNQYRKQGVDIVAVKYEDLVKYPLQATRTIFEYCEVPTEWAEDAVKALNKDAQRKSPLSMKNLNKIDHAQLTPERKKQTDLICEQFGLPKIPEECVLDGTITHIGKMAASMANGHSNGHT